MQASAMWALLYAKPHHTRLTAHMAPLLAILQTRFRACGPVTC